ncbi:MAG: AI-2E family transporter [Actinomycetota bacterium]
MSSEAERDNSETSNTKAALPLWVTVMPRWVWRAVAIFWVGYLVTLSTRFMFDRLTGLLLLLLVSLFLALAIEPGVNRLAARGWRRGSATAIILLAVFLFTVIFVVAIASLVGGQIADILNDTPKTITKVVGFINRHFNTDINPQKVIDSTQDPDGAFQRFIRSQQAKAFDVSVAALGVLLQLFSVLLFTFYLVADGPRMRRSICSRMRPERQQRVLYVWELAITKTGGYLYSRALLASFSAFFHWVLFQSLGTRAPIAMALWVGLISQFLPVVGTYLAGALPILLALVDSPGKALVMLVFVVLYQQLENYLFLPRITARTMELHPAWAFGAALAGGAVLGPVGAILALPAAAMAQAVLSESGVRHEVIDVPLTRVGSDTFSIKKRRRKKGDQASADESSADEPA